MNKNHWIQIAETIKMVPKGFVVIENQQNFSESFFLTNEMALRQQGENHRKMDMLVDNGVIQL